MQVVIVGAVRTPIGSFQGGLSSLPATRLGSIAIGEALRKVQVKGDRVDEVIMGNVLAAGLGQAPARQASIGAGLPKSVPCTTVNKVCGSGLKAVVLAARAIQSGDASVVVAGGMESMSNAPYLLTRARSGYRMGHGELIDSMIRDGLWDAYHDFHMGAAAELCADTLQVTREEQDRFALTSYRRALKAQQEGAFQQEIVPVKWSQDTAEVILQEDEEPRRFRFERLPTLKPSFKKDGTVTAGNASSISDGAAALVVMSEEKARSLGLSPLARIVGYTLYATEPEWFTTAPTRAISALLERTGRRQVSDVDLFEINEAFAVCLIAIQRQLGLDPEKVNVRGGAVALGHPIGASGARILTTLIHALADMKLGCGIASLCIGGGEAVAMMVERV